MNLMLIVLGSLVSIMNPIGTVAVFVSLNQSLYLKINWNFYKNESALCLKKNKNKEKSNK